MSAGAILVPGYSSMKNRRNYYRVLQVQPDAPIEIIRASFRTLMRELKQHPDLGGSTYNAAILNEAYETLNDPVRRQAYDKELFARYTKKPDTSGMSPLVTVFCPVCRKPSARKPQPGERCLTCQSPLVSQKEADLRRACPRSLERTNRYEPIAYYATWPGKPCPGMMVDFSPRGMRFRCSEKLSPKTVLKISCSLLEASASVTNCRADQVGGETMYTVGVCFLAVTFVEARGTLLSTSA